MPFTINGIGTKLYGHKPLSDGSYVTTEWLVIFFLPILPVRSIRIVETGPAYRTVGYSSQSTKSHKVPLDKPMVAKMYGFAVLFLLALIFGVPLLNRLVTLL